MSTKPHFSSQDIINMVKHRPKNEAKYIDIDKSKYDSDKPGTIAVSSAVFISMVSFLLGLLAGYLFL